VLYQDWIRGTKAHSKAIELFGSLQVSAESRPIDQEEWCRRKAYLAIFRAIIIRERSKGLALEEISRRWKVESLAGIEEAWRDDRLWLLNALGGICDLRCFYHHLRTEMWRFGRPCPACEAINAAVARTGVSDCIAVEVLFAAGRAAGGASSLSRVWVKRPFKN